MAVQWLKFHTSTSGNARSTSGKGTNPTCCSVAKAKKKEKKTHKNRLIKECVYIHS